MGVEGAVGRESVQDGGDGLGEVPAGGHAAARGGTGIKVAERPTGPGLLRWLRSRRFRIADDSMRPALQDGDRVLVDRSAYAAAPPAVGDVVALEDPELAGRFLVKRVAAVGPSDHVAAIEGIRDPGATIAVPVPAGTVYVRSDAPEGRDSRRFGPVPRGRLLGRVWYRIGPPGRRGPIGPTP